LDVVAHVQVVVTIGDVVESTAKGPVVAEKMKPFFDVGPEPRGQNFGCLPCSELFAVLAFGCIGNTFPEPDELSAAGL